MLKFIKTTFYSFGLLCILFIPFPFHIFPYQAAISGFIFKPILVFISETLFNEKLINPEISSDSRLMFLLILLLFVLSVLVSFVLTSPFKTSKVSKKTLEVFGADVFGASRKIFAYYLALQLLKYGLDKVFKGQFYLPEPNILYTPLGQLDKDILYWSTMGTSYSYNLFLGLAEVIAASLILFRKTRILGLMLACGILLNVVAINLSFDISVKIYSTFLLFLSLLLLAPQFIKLYKFLILQKNTSLVQEAGFAFKSRLSGNLIKALVICLIFTEVFYPYLKNQNYNDDLAPRPFLHGAYEITAKASPFKRFFIHRDGYIIFQNTNDEMQDFKLDIDRINKQFVLTDYQLNETKYPFNWNSKEGILQINLGKNILEGKATDWKQLPVLQTNFHWTVD